MQPLHEYMSYSSPTPISRRSRIQRACIACRRRKIKCNGNLEGCAHCAEKEQKCRYEPVSDDEKLKAQSYKRHLIQRRQQTRVYFDTRQFAEPMMYAAAYGMVPYSMGFYSPQPAINTSHALMQEQLASPFSLPSTPSPTHQNFNPYFSAAASLDTSAQLQSITGASPSSQPISAPLDLESLSQTPELLFSLSSPTLSASSSSSFLLTPMRDSFSELLTAPISTVLPSVAFEQNSCGSTQIHIHDFAGGLELYNIPCTSSTDLGTLNSNLTVKDLTMMSAPAPSAESSNSSYQEQVLLPLPTYFNFASTPESAVAPSALTEALA
ncbi:uncharacterized protein MEPE_05255 [Melanopsichium pennsylvanicum]|uniref:Zn(2)-C6 fungal-type domain-containing protein n=2 Tax=Melanopsichium pennsylvanicum TaxID=63383 RepID=A0AAJ4XRF9_9BASI|nr:uncharacterized protein BN887_05485 [Melanopsichium pennsylvanicum 4]SNX86546.1 uncharacterized protein MEPE_05255 [Melanopsichium pennsylvanicum]